VAPGYDWVENWTKTVGHPSRTQEQLQYCRKTAFIMIYESLFDSFMTIHVLSGISFKVCDSCLICFENIWIVEVLLLEL